MSIKDLISMAVRNLWKRKLRTFLTILGVILGTASIVVMVSIGIGMNESYTKQVSEWGSLQVIDVYAPNGGMGVVMSSGSSSSSSSKNNGNVVLDTKAIQSFKNIPGVMAATPVVNDYFQIICGKYVSDVSFIGIDPECFDDLGYNIAEGRGLTGEDKNAIVVGQTVLTSFYNPKLDWRARYNSDPPEVDIFNDKVQLTYDYSYGTKNADKSIKPIKVEVVGTLAGSDQNAYSVIMPIKQLESIQKEKQKHESAGGSTTKKKSGNYERAMVRVEDIEKVQSIQQQIKDMGYNASSLSDILESMKETTKMLRTMLGAIGAISLIVAAIGITNTMVMSIYERTREIGVMKVIGASLKDIKRLFLTEAAIIGFMGGIFGMLLSFGASKAVNYFAMKQSSDMLSSIPLWLYLASLAFATLVGVVSGYLPAKRAMKLSALTAIKTE